MAKSKYFQDSSFFMFIYSFFLSTLSLRNHTHTHTHTTMQLTIPLFSWFVAFLFNKPKTTISLRLPTTNFEFVLVGKIQLIFLSAITSFTDYYSLNKMAGFKIDSNFTCFYFCKMFIKKHRTTKHPHFRPTNQSQALLIYY